MSNKKVFMSVTATAVIASALALPGASDATELSNKKSEAPWTVSLKHDLIVKDIDAKEVVKKRAHKSEDAEERSASVGQDGSHEVVSGDTLSEIAHKYGVSTEDLMAWNNLSNTLIIPGQELVLNGDAVAEEALEIVEVDEEAERAAEVEAAKAAEQEEAEKDAAYRAEAERIAKAEAAAMARAQAEAEEQAQAEADAEAEAQAEEEARAAAEAELAEKEAAAAEEAKRAEEEAKAAEAEAEAAEKAEEEARAAAEAERAEEEAAAVEAAEAEEEAQAEEAVEEENAEAEESAEVQQASNESTNEVAAMTAQVSNVDEQAEKDRAAAEKKAEEDRIAAQKKKEEAQRVAAEKKAEQDRIAAEKKKKEEEAAKKAAEQAKQQNVGGGDLISNARSVMGTPYVWGGSQPGGFDCSGFIHWAHKESGNDIGRTTVEGYYNKSYIVNNPQPGDLVFFEGTYKSGMSHMGIYIGGGQMIHAGSSTGVAITSVKGPYWGDHFHSYKRFY